MSDLQAVGADAGPRPPLTYDRTYCLEAGDLAGCYVRHSDGWLLVTPTVHDRDDATLVARPPRWSPPDPGGTWLRPADCSDAFVTHRDGVAVVARPASRRDGERATFAIESGLLTRSTGADPVRRLAPAPPVATAGRVVTVDDHGQLMVSSGVPATEASESLFAVHARPAGDGDRLVAFESVGRPGWYLRSAGGRRLRRPAGGLVSLRPARRRGGGLEPDDGYTFVEVDTPGQGLRLVAADGTGRRLFWQGDEIRLATEGPPGRDLFCYVTPPSTVSLAAMSSPGAYLRHRRCPVGLHANEGVVLESAASQDLRFKEDASYVCEEGLAGRGASFRAFCPSGSHEASYVRHRDGRLWVDPLSGDEEFRRSATFLAEVPGPWCVSWQLPGPKGGYVVVRPADHRVSLSVRPEDPELATFVVLAGLADPSGVSFEVLGCPGQYLQRRLATLEVGPVTKAGALGATFRLRRPRRRSGEDGGARAAA